MGSVVVVVFFFLGGGGQLPVFVLIGWRTINNHVLCLWAKYIWVDNMVQVTNKEMWVSEVSACFLQEGSSEDSTHIGRYNFECRNCRLVEIRLKYPCLKETCDP